MHTLNIALVALASRALAHGDHSQKPIVDENANWMTKHMAEEHHMDGWDAASFFTLHDYNSDGVWQGDEILRTYGLFDDSNKHLTEEKRFDILHELLELLDTNQDGSVDRAEWDSFMSSGKTLPDKGTGPGHHGDDEYEYEIHHWEKYHDEDTKLEDLNHPEDIEHFKKHEEMEDEQERLEQLDHMAVVESNIPTKFMRS
ncbi:putative calcium-binding protein [Colletotrichum sidae]|uniref:Calcium-binding protein n=3 Tax=Colletotrichum orbiculare species complex TaxID=2707354 RepID=N4VL96_COLOR|nr:putative calcium-binding protein [Colletotrichum orbiculare MAFF 240422]TDZ37896.1 putative calcium-binding protein [Colletotrichum spinosum]TEA15877.1 putative calcium-binding protein [Colletotrichum sidae]